MTRSRILGGAASLAVMVAVSLLPLGSGPPRPGQSGQAAQAPTEDSARKLAKFTDVRELQRRLKAQGVALVNEADETTKGPASFMAVDPDGNPILFDQHV